MTPESIIEHALIDAKAQGLSILGGGAMFEWKDEKVIGCDAIGAVLLHFNLAKMGFPQGWLNQVCNLLGIDYYWFWRFCRGFDHGTTIEIITKHGKKEKITKDSISKLGVELRQKYKN
jgi:hypothetical protein